MLLLVSGALRGAAWNGRLRHFLPKSGPSFVSKRGHSEPHGLTSAFGRPCRSMGSLGTATMFQMPGEVAPRQRRGAINSNFGILGEGECVFHIDPEIAHRVLDLAMTEKDLDGTEVAGRPVDDRRLRPAK